MSWAGPWRPGFFNRVASAIKALTVTSLRARATSMAVSRRCGGALPARSTRLRSGLVVGVPRQMVVHSLDRSRL